MIKHNVSFLSSGIEMIHLPNSSFSLKTPAQRCEEKKQKGGLVWGSTKALIIEL